MLGGLRHDRTEKKSSEIYHPRHDRQSQLFCAYDRGRDVRRQRCRAGRARRGQPGDAVCELHLGAVDAVQYRRCCRRFRAAGARRHRGRESGVYACAVGKYRCLFDHQRDGHAAAREDRAAARRKRDLSADGLGLYFLVFRVSNLVHARSVPEHLCKERRQPKARTDHVPLLLGSQYFRRLADGLSAAEGDRRRGNCDRRFRPDWVFHRIVPFYSEKKGSSGSGASVRRGLYIGRSCFADCRK